MREHPPHPREDFTPEDTERLRQGLDVILTRLSAWETETPGACSCDMVEIMARAFAVVMVSAGARLSERDFQKMTGEMIRVTRDFCRNARADRQIMGQLLGIIAALEAEDET